MAWRGVASAAKYRSCGENRQRDSNNNHQAASRKHRKLWRETDTVRSGGEKSRAAKISKHGKQHQRNGVAA